MTKQELENRIFGEDEFIGTEMNRSKADKYITLANIAKAVCTKRNGFTGLEIENVNDKHHRNCSVYADLQEVGSSVDRGVIEGVRMLLDHSDFVSYSTIGGKLRITFSVFDVWSDGKPFERGDLSEITEEEGEEIDRLVDEHFDSLTPEQLEEISRA